MPHPAPPSPTPLAVDGGPPRRTTPFPPWPYYAADEIDAVGEVLHGGRVNYLNSDHCARFEAAFAALCQRRHAIAVANGTLALELALVTLGIGPGDEVVVPPRTFIASASCVIRQGATPVFADVDRETQNITAQTIAPVITPRTRAIIPVHLAGMPCDMDPIMALAAQHGLAVVEDCAQAHGARYKGRPVGSMGHMAAFSFCQDKIITTGGEGGMLLLDDERQWKAAWAYKDHGKDYELFHNPPPEEGFRWFHTTFGSNWRLTGMQAAIGLRQLDKLPAWQARRAANAAVLTRHCRAIPALRMVAVPPEYQHAWYKYYLFVRPERLRPGWDRNRVQIALQAEGLPCFNGTCPELYRERAFMDRGIGPPARLPVARELGETGFMLPVHPTLAAADMEDMGAAIGKVMAVAMR